MVFFCSLCPESQLEWTLLIIINFFFLPSTPQNVAIIGKLMSIMSPCRLKILLLQPTYMYVCFVDN
ncbi:hypothetical protein BDV30DRAFT_113627 [Aspergillus minisclerotigenes]|uniref:Uncharacterized protein n=1 Tax=Aspergillus minisclerotigenes TaxID=656917 RepID=A0A5N6J4G8_9EURO|nr:hypothetical protein BDV30DRAFT_113627 [Aspergillus minisclerotigenes]